MPEMVPTRDADRDAAEQGGVFLSHVSASAIEAVCLLMVDSLDLETLMKFCPGRRFVGMQIRSIRDAGANERCGVAFRTKTAGTELPPRSRTVTITLRSPLGSWETDNPAVFLPM